MISIELLLLISMGAMGLLWGSFANAAIHRIPREIPLGLSSHRRSRCPQCQAVIRAQHNIPVLSFLWLKGRCADCKASISWRYPAVELITLATFLAATYLFLQNRGFSWGHSAIYSELAFLSLQLYFLWSLWVVTFIDIDFRIIPDRFSLGNWGLALGAALIWSQPDVLTSLLGSLMGFGLFYLLAWGYEKTKGVEGLGFGDVKMMGWLGAWLGFEWVPFIILTASLSGLILGVIQARRSGEGMQTALPFGPFLAFGAMLAWFLKFSSISVERLVF